MTAARGAHDPRLPVHVLTGFLGSGKTTLLNHLLRDPELSDSAVVVNEFGDIAIDHLLVERSDDNLVQLAGGCLCCTVREDLANTIAHLLCTRSDGRCTPFRRIIIETTGLADPAPILNLLLTDPLLAEHTRPGRVVATIDAVNGERTLARHPESVNQAALADTLVLTRSDMLVQPPGALIERLERINAGAPRVQARSGVPDPAAGLFDDTDRGSGLDRALRGGHEHVHSDGISTFTLRRSSALPAAALALFAQTLIEHLGADLLRIKGLVRLAESPTRPALLQGAQHVLQPVDSLPAWPDPADMDTRIVLITRGDAREWIERVFDATVSEVESVSRMLDHDDAVSHQPRATDQEETRPCSI